MVLNDHEESSVAFFFFFLPETAELVNLVFKRKMGNPCVFVWLSPVSEIGIGIGGCNM